jgi:hypothetical protein
MLWVRSYWVTEIVQNDRSSGTFQIGSYSGTVAIGGNLNLAGDINPFATPTEEWSFIRNARIFNPVMTTCGFAWNSGKFRTLAVPYWFIVLIFVATAAVPWIRFRFTIRTLLIATTLVAVAIWAIVWLSARPPATPAIDQADLPDF